MRNLYVFCGEDSRQARATRGNEREKIRSLPSPCAHYVWLARNILNRLVW
ncbi:MAG: hypothetical protein A4E74_01553 [Syntrophus sp. PtaB.Bin075]|nr:MAG: hypothetical protein A4E74_01553 [Syntrophus sp. PtaB.Bin075]